MNDLLAGGRIGVVQSEAHQHLFAVERPTLGKNAVVVNVADEVRVVKGVAKLQKVPRNALVPENRQDRLPRVRHEEALIRRREIRNEIKTFRIRAQHRRRIHEAARIRCRQCLRDLHDVERPDVRRDVDDVVRLQKRL